MNNTLYLLKAVREKVITASYMSVLVVMDEYSGGANTHDLAKSLEQSLPILRTNLTRMENAGWVEKIDVNMYISTNKWDKLKKDAPK